MSSNSPFDFRNADAEPRDKEKSASIDYSIYQKEVSGGLTLFSSSR